MKNQFSFIDQPILTALKSAITLLPGLDRVDLLWNDPTTLELKLISVFHKNTSELVYHRIKKNNISVLNNFRSQKPSVSWYSHEELPFNEMNEKVEDEGIFNEVLKSILCISFENNTDKLSDLFIFYFRKDASEFGPIKEGNILSTNQKLMIGRLLHNSLKTILYQLNSNREIMIGYNKNISEMIQHQNKTIEKSKQETKLLSSFLDDILMRMIDEVNDSNDLITLKEETKEILRPYLYDKYRVKLALKNAILFVKTLQFGMGDAALELLPFHFKDFQKVEEVIIKERENKSRDELYAANTKTYQFLEALERASKYLSQRNIKLTSNRVGQTLEHQITAAAISDKIKNHKRKIILLLEQYPEKWMIIRNRFKPIINIQERDREEKVA